jgi:3-oxoacyl-[acyl-carrier protein] reductase
MPRLIGKVAIVTGAARGIGRAIAEALAADGAAVAVGYLARAAEAEGVAQAIIANGGRAVAVQGDVADEAGVRRLFRLATDALGPPDIVVANAGVVVSGPLAQATEADFDDCFAVNTRGAFFTLAEAARQLREGGRIVAISTNLTLTAFAGYGLYAGSKAAVEQFVRVLAREVGHRGITVNAVAPGPTDTDMMTDATRRSAPAATPLGRVGRPDDIADVVAFLASDQGRWITGQILGANGGIV